jgi:quinol monooxygenase YgiN
MLKQAERAAGRETGSTVIELRQYTLRPGQRDTMIEIFESNLIEPQEDAGATIIGHFRDLENPDRFVWLRGFRDMPARLRALTDFYSSKIWKQHSRAINETLIDCDDVLLLRPAARGTAYVPKERPRADADGGALVVATIYSLAAAVDGDFGDFFGRSLEPALTEARAPCLASFVTEPSENDYPALPVREGENVFVWLSSFRDGDAYDRHRAALASAPAWPALEAELQRRLDKPVQILQLEPAARSRLR